MSPATTPPTARRATIVGLMAHLVMMGCIGSGHAEGLPPTAFPPPFLFSVDVLLDEADAPVPLGIRDGQTFAQAAAFFCQGQGFDEATQAALMPQLIKVLEDGVADAARDSPVDKDQSPPSPALEYADLDNEAASAMYSSDGDVVPHFDLEISLDGMETRTLSYYADQDPTEVALGFCTDNLPPSSHSEAFTRCSSALEAHILERVNPVYSSPPGYGRQDDAHTEPWLTVPLNIDGVETALEINEGSAVEDLADEICHREEFGLAGSSLDSCSSQVANIAQRAVAAYGQSQDREERRQQQAEADSFTFKVPVTLAGLQLHAEFRTSETPHESALRFCEPNLPAIESALGLELVDEENGDIGQSDEGILSEGRDALKQACAVVVEDAINAVLLGLRERVLEAEMAQKNVTERQHNDDERWLQKESVEGNVDGTEESWAARQTAADTSS